MLYPLTHKCKHYMGNELRQQWEDILTTASQELLKLIIDYHKQQKTDPPTNLNPNLSCKYAQLPITNPQLQT